MVFFNQIGNYFYTDIFLLENELLFNLDMFRNNW